MIILDKDHISLQFGVWDKITANIPVTWSSNNSNVVVDRNGWVIALRDVLREVGDINTATITASANNETSASCAITVVTWPTNKVALETIEYIPDYPGLNKSSYDGHYYCVTNSRLLKTLDMVNFIDVRSAIPINQNPLLITPYGFFSSAAGAIYKIPLNFSSIAGKLTGFAGLYHMFDSYYDDVTQKLYVYAGEYTTVNTDRHKVFRITYTSNVDTGTLETILEFYSRSEHEADAELTPFCRHIHVVTVDQATGHVYIGTGDGNNTGESTHDENENKILISEDHGDTFRELGKGSQNWRMLSIWFTDNYIYWNNDTDKTQSLWRIKRTDLAAQSPSNDLKEQVIELANGSHWYHCWAKDHLGDDVVIMGSAAEGCLRDLRGRVFSIKELSSGEVEVNELISVVGYQSSNVPFVQLEPKIQDDNGYIYLRARDTALGRNLLWKTRMIAQIPRTDRHEFRNSFVFKNPVF